MDKDFVINIILDTNLISYAWIITPSSSLNDSNTTKAINDIAIIAKFSPFNLESSFINNYSV